jgi:outer membrane protein OmpU
MNSNYKKELTMNKLTKIGVSALCGSLAGVSAANAGDLSVSGGADMTWMSKSDATVGNPIGIGSNYSLTGSGDLENGWNVALTIAMTNANAYSNTSVVVGVPGIGDIKVNQGGSGTGIQAMDDITPTVWEEADGAGLSAGITKVKGTSAGATIQVTPDMTPDGLTAVLAWSPDSDGSSSTNDKGTGGDSGTLSNGWDLTLTATDELHGISGLTLYGGLSRVDQFDNATSIGGDSEERVLGLKYAVGALTVGVQQNNDDTGLVTSGEYDNLMYSATFNVNDDLSIGYGHVESEKKDSNTAEADSVQIAYTMGGATFRVAEIKVDNQAYSTAASAQLDATVISLGLAF